MKTFPRLALAAALLALGAAPLRAQYDPAPHPMFDGDAVHTIRITFEQPYWYTLLVQNFEGQADPLYLPATFDWENVHLEDVGVRFKGNSSYNGYPGPKKSFKLKFDEFVATQSVYGLDKLNLNNAFRNPAFVREKCAYDVAAQMGLPVGRANYAALYVNGTYWGLYYVVEDVDKELIESRFGSSEDGNLWKALSQADLTYRGPNGSDYEGSYRLETNEAANDWSALVELADGLSHAPPAELAGTLHAAMDVDCAMAMLAFDNALVNLDSYLSSAHNYYLYHRDSDGRFSFLLWDLNGSFGALKAGMPVSALVDLPVLWSGSSSPGNRPLAERSWEVPEYRALYLSHVRRLARGPLEPDTLLPRMEALRDLVRPYVRADGFKMYTNQEFEDALLADIGLGHNLVPALDPFIRARHASLLAQLGAWTGRAIVLNELMASNTHTAQDGQGEPEDWFEVVNAGDQALSLAGLTATDDPGAPGAYAFPDVTLQPGEHYLVWADGEPAEGPDHADFGLRKDGESLFLFDGAELLDATTWGGLADDQVLGRASDATGAWTSDLMPTPGAANARAIGDGTLLVNELLASNANGITDEAGQHEDWLEVWNPGDQAVDVGGWYLTDDLGVPTRWQLPDGASVPAGGHLLVWCDEDLADGPLHADFKLSAGGEAIGLFGPASAGTPLIDSHVFGPQTTDVSEGRAGDGARTWTFFGEPTPGATNVATWPRPLLYGIGKRTSSDTVPLLAYAGEPSAAATGGFAITIERARPHNVGILFHGAGRAQAPFFGATLWVAPPIVRVGARMLDASGATSYPVPIDAGLIGTLRDYQFYFRDPPQPDGTGAGTTNALEVVFAP